ncbi:MAG: sodium:solute symporter family protein [Cyclobacteriaceae bacterium]|nr:sodium:solute symporter family protein [Cyclobacteriaceae bacterium]
MFRILIFMGIVYVSVLFFLANRAKSVDKTSKQYLLGGSNLGALLGFFTIAATLFSTFSLLGMPDFFRVHGIGAWIFLMFSHCVMTFGLIWLGYQLHKKAKNHSWRGMAGFMGQNYGHRFAGIVAFFGVFVFLIPYISIQIRGVAIFLSASFPGVIPMWAWATILVIIMLIYSEVGGLKAIMHSDVLQGVLLLVAIWIIGYNCLNHFGGVRAMFEEVEIVNEALLSVPGPKGLFDFQFLLGSMIAISLMPYTQPQISTRLVILKNVKSLYKMAISLGIFGIIIILPTAFMGMYGAVLYPEFSTSEFLNKTYIGDQTNFVASVVMIGIIAAAISTSDSQLFALGGELRSILKGEDRKMVKYARVGIFFFALIALLFALMSSDELALLARTSFAGTALLAPMILTGIFYDHAHRIRTLPLLTLVALLIFIASLVGWLPHQVTGIRMDLALITLLSAISLLMILFDKIKNSRTQDFS